MPWPWCSPTEPSMPLRPKVLPYLKGQRPEEVAMIDLREDARSIVATLDRKSWTTQRAFFGLGRRVCYYFAF